MIMGLLGLLRHRFRVPEKTGTSPVDYSHAMSVRADQPPTSSSDVLAELAAIVRLVTDRSLDEVQPDRAFVDDLRIDSLSMVEILEGASQHFGVRIEDEAAKGFVRVSDLVGYITARTGGS
jgi:acyl carrier protein